MSLKPRRSTSALPRKRRLAARGHVVEQRHALEARRDLGQLLGIRCLDEQHVGAGLPVLRGALERGVEAFYRDRVGTRDDDEVRIGAASAAARILATASATGTTCFPARWPQRLGIT